MRPQDNVSHKQGVHADHFGHRDVAHPNLGDLVFWNAPPSSYIATVKIRNGENTGYLPCI